MKNEVQLITYVDRLGGGDILALRELLTHQLDDLFGSVHLLPFYYPYDGADAGFDPIDHTRVDPRLGTWDDISALGEDVAVMADLIVNHVSARSPQFLDYCRNGSASPFAGMFLKLGTVFPHGVTEQELLSIYRPRPGLPLTEAKLAGGTRRLLWTTFTSEQIDIDVRDPQGEAYLQSILETFGDAGVRMIRLDAVGYAIKKPGTSCFMIPGTYAFIDELAGRARALGMEVLVEIHAYYQQQIDVARRVDRVYDFALPPLILHAFFYRTARPLRNWLEISPRNAVTVLDTHDGIGVIDIGPAANDPAGHPGLIPPEEVDALVEMIHENSRGLSRQATGTAASNVDLYQVNCTYYDALGRNRRDYLLARAIQFFAPGIPQIYYVGLLAGENDMELLARTGVGRDINRQYFDMAKIEAALAKPMVRDLLRLIRWRNQEPAFAGSFTLLEGPDHVLGLRWENGERWAELRVDFADMSHSLTYGDADQGRRMDLLAHSRGALPRR